ncbi:hypothetical protein [Paraflavitalea pollutisoli]|uniref:hypothetical protein n=1 Tax=Paraflavitalea pollutisoli TaxID=3034143 RepID=UPI0023EDFD99|nr:hypothetical protein [Paraflavitalea sp. H1-2-19X]
MSIPERLSKPTPPFFKKLRNVSLILAAASGALLASADLLPKVLQQAACYIAVAGTVAGAVSQAVVKEEEQ